MPYCGTRSSGAGFVSLEAMQAAALVWYPVGRERSCRPLAGAAPAVVFDAVEAARLQPLPRARFDAGRLVDPDVRPGHPRQGRAERCTRCRGGYRVKVDARATATTVQIFHAAS